MLLVTVPLSDSAGPDIKIAFSVVTVVDALPGLPYLNLRHWQADFFLWAGLMASPERCELLVLIYVFNNQFFSKTF